MLNTNLGEYMEKIKVSIKCLVYNHEQYLRKCLDGFVMQKTNFKFEAIVHDDASTDNSANIIREYALKYPDIIKPIYQTENQYTKNDGSIGKLMNKECTGNYIALCEGDDYWTDMNKLQLQSDCLDSNPDCTFCFTNADLFDVSTGKTNLFITELNNEDISGKEIMSIGVGELINTPFIPTASYFFRASNYNKFPTCFNENMGAGDRKLSLFSTAIGRAIFINKKTCVYRKNVPNSVMTKWQTLNYEESYNLAKSFHLLYEKIDEFTNYEYSHIITPLYDAYKKQMIVSGIAKGLRKNKDFNDCIKRQSFKVKTKLLIADICPKMLHAILKIKHKIPRKIIRS